MANKNRRSRRSNRRLPVNYVPPRRQVIDLARERRYIQELLKYEAYQAHRNDEAWQQIRDYSRPRRQNVRLAKLISPATDTRLNRRGRKRAAASTLAAAVAGNAALRGAVCVQRSQRKEVMFATRKAGRVGQKKPRFTWKSKVRC